MGTSGLSTVGQVLSAIFVLSLVALVAELLYVLWRRRFLRRRSTPVDATNPEALRNSFPTSKELLYFLCWKQHRPSRVEPDGGPGGGSDPETGRIGPEPEDPTEEVIDILKLQAMRGPSRVLFTIKEEEREDVESETSVCSAEKSHHEKTRRVSLEEFLNTMPEEVTVITASEDWETTPYSTPCDSPLYYTPTASPIRGFA
ncbi:hypothetical protein C3L33_02454, partial [Rhododendron williamsianum]